MRIVKQKSGADERTILIGMITNPAVLGRLSGLWKEGDLEQGLFESKYANLIGKFCISYFKKYDEAPQKNIGSIYRAWAGAKVRDENLVELVESFLESLSEEYDEDRHNTDYVLDVAAKYFEVVALNKLADAIKGDLALGQSEEALEKVTNFNKPELGVDVGFDLFSDPQRIQEAFEEGLDPIIEWPGDLGTFLNPTFTRDSFISFMGPEKRGKTWWLIETAFQALKSRCKVAMFSIGDMSEKQIIRRFAVRMAGRPFRGGSYEKPSGLRWEENDGHRTLEVDYDTIEVESELSWRPVVKAAERMMRGRTSSMFKMSVHSNATMTMSLMHSIIDRWAVQGWVPDVIVVDYADLVEPPYGMEERQGINHNWKYMRRLSQDYHSCFVTATQSDAGSYDSYLLTKRHFTGDKRKLSHVTGMLGINMTFEEKNKQLTRLNWIVNREEDWSEDKTVHVAGCLKVGRPAILSIL